MNTRTWIRSVVFSAAASTALTAAENADAFCGFYVSGADAKLFNDATQVVLMREGTRTVLSMQNAYKGPPSDFAMVVPVPVVLQKENVKTLPRAIFDKVDTLTAPRLVEYWEQDPCAQTEWEEKSAVRRVSANGITKKEGAAGADHGVKVEAQFTVGEYEIVILSAKDSTGLDTWLREKKYKIPDGAEPYLRPYVQQGSKFFVAKVNVQKVPFENGQALLSPLRFHYDSEKFELPIRLGLANSGGTQDLIVNVLSRGQRYEAANYDNVTIPTNLDVAEGAKGSFAAFYAALFDKTLEQKPRAVVTEYAWDAGSCDPCPTPGLDPQEITTLGADVLTNSAAVVTRRPMWGVNGFVITRLHARYKKDALGEDIVFRAAPPIAGGREWRNAGALEKQSHPDGVNNFQGRYAIRHPWQGPIACKEPQRNRWGGPWNGAAPSTPAAASKVAFAPRGGVQLAALVKEDVPEIGLTLASMAPPVTSTTPPAPPLSPGVAPLPMPPPPTKSTGGCAGCSSSTESAAPLGALGVALAILFASRRRTRS